MERAKSLVIVESPAKARTLARYLGSTYIVRASKGHVKDLPKNRLGVAVDRGFEPQWVIIEGRGSILKELRALAQRVDQILLATDPDREGEAISYHIAEELKATGKPMARIWLREITRRGIRQALQELRTIDPHLVEAQFARRILDRLVGYQISPLLWDKIWRGLSAGRVQSVALRLIVEREREIEQFVPREYWTIRARLQPTSLKKDEANAFWARLVRFRGRKIDLPDEAAARAAEATLRAGPFEVVRVQQRRRRQAPPPPFITSTLQQVAARRWRWSAQKTMTVAQRLYEGVDLPQGRTGLITYMRTDSTRIADEALKAVRELIAERFGDGFLPPSPRRFRTAEGAQDAHEAIRPTDVRMDPEALKTVLPADEWRLYDLIWHRFVACQMADAQFDVTTITVRVGDYELEAKGEVLVEPGYRILFEEEEEEREDEARRLPPLQEGEVLQCLDLDVQQNWTEPPPRYTEATLIRELERRGIGRPSTYATIVSIIQNRDYVVKEGVYFRPTALGRLVCELLEEFFPDLMDYEYTARMESLLDAIERGEKGRQEVLQSFYGILLRQLKRAHQEMPSYKGGVELSAPCPSCGEGRLILRWSRNGGFVYCSRQTEGCSFKADYEAMMTPPSDSTTQDSACPRCGASMHIMARKPHAWIQCPTCRLQAVHGAPWPAFSDRPCPQGHPTMALQYGRFGYFYRCVEPDCSTTAPVYTGLPCLAPDCSGEIVVRSYQRGRRRETFFGCSAYPNCDFTFTGQPVSRACPACDAPYRVRIRRRLVCVRPGCSQRSQVRKARTV